MRRWLLLSLLLLTGLALAGIVGRDELRGLTLLVRAAHLHGPIRRLAELDTVAVSERSIQAPVGRHRRDGRGSRSGALRDRARGHRSHRGRDGMGGRQARSLAGIVLLNVADQVVPSDQVEPVRQAVRLFLEASYLRPRDPGQAERDMRALRAAAGALPDPAAMLVRLLLDGDVAHLGPRLLPYVDAHASAPALSPARSPAPSAPVFLIHGRDDDVIPVSESRTLAARLKGRVPVHLVLTDLIAHVQPEQPPRVADVLRTARFWGDVLAR
jgi:pimeloyl-ACP methyl ester carboxylesterase